MEAYNLKKKPNQKHHHLRIAGELAEDNKEWHNQEEITAVQANMTREKAAIIWLNTTDVICIFCYYLFSFKQGTENNLHKHFQFHRARYYP